MKKWSFKAFILAQAALLSFVCPSFAAEIKLGLVNFKKCVEESKIGKQEEASFEAMKKQMENVVEDKEKTLNELATKLNDQEHLSLISDEAELEMRRKFRTLSQELNQMQSQYYQTLNQANFKIVQKLSEIVGKASSKVAQDQKLDLVINDETCFFTTNSLDVSKMVVKEMDQMFTEEAKTAASAQN